MNLNFFKELTEELHLGVSQKGHPFRYFTVATVGLDRMARLRTVVLRNVTENLMIRFFTDKRSKKITHIKENPKVSMLFYHPQKLVQLKIEGLASINTEAASLKAYWDKIPLHARKDYATTKSPGTTIGTPEDISYVENQDHFCAIDITPFKIEYLKLKSPNHLRVRFTKKEESWNSEFLVP